MAITNALESQLDTLKVARAQREQLVEAAKSDFAKARTGIRHRIESAKASLKETVIDSVSHAVGGAVVEPVRRQVVGRYFDTVRGQALALAVAGVGVSTLTAKWPMISAIGKAHSAVAGWMLSVSMYGEEGAKDPVVIALEGTTHKAKKDRKAKKE